MRNMEENTIVKRDPKIFRFNFDWPKYVDTNLKYEIEFMIKSNKVLAENEIKNEIERLLLKYKNGTIFMNTENSKASKWTTSICP